MSFKDRFSRKPQAYARFRPSYPKELFEYLVTLTNNHGLAWDCATGSGQAARGLATHFTRIIATDASTAQIATAIKHAQIFYAAAAAEQAPLKSKTIDLVTVAQALHWFDRKRFYSEVKRVLSPEGAIVAWCYGLNRITPAVDAVVRHYNHDIVGPYWPGERRFIDEKYQTLNFPFAELTAPSFEMTLAWSLDQFLGYLGTWSATQNFLEIKGNDPLALIRASLKEAWGDPLQKRPITWPIHMRAGRLT